MNRADEYIEHLMENKLIKVGAGILVGMLILLIVSGYAIAMIEIWKAIEWALGR